MKPAHHQTTAAQKLTRSRVQLLILQPFFGTLCLRLKLVPGSLPTMATDGSRIVYNPVFVDQLKPAELEGTRVLMGSATRMSNCGRSATRRASGPPWLTNCI